MEYIEDVRSLMQAINFAQSKGAFSLEQSGQLAPVYRRILNRYPQLKAENAQQVQTTQQPQQPQQPQPRATPQLQPQQPVVPPRPKQDKIDELIQTIKAEPNKVSEQNENENNIEISKKELVQTPEPIGDGIEAISLPLQ